jgi:hypothetical protein
MRAIGRIVAFLMIYHDFQREFEVEFGQSQHALHQHFALRQR